jgi:hypothetical protein
MNVEHARVALLVEDQLIYFNDENSPVYVDKTIGIMGDAIKEKKIVNIFNCYTHVSFNPGIDL